MQKVQSKRRIGILGGSFDPIHQGHINIALSAREEFDLDEVWFIPAGHSPNKNESQMTAADTRAAMVELAIAPYPFFAMSRIEIEAEETSYTYLTLTRLKEAYPDTKFFFIMGADSLDYFEHWFHPEIICEKATVLVAVRDSMDLAVIDEKIAAIKQLFPAEIYPIRGGRTDVSSTEIRTALSDMAAEQGDDTIGIAKPVREYIWSHGLYGSHDDGDK